MNAIARNLVLAFVFTSLVAGCANETHVLRVGAKPFSESMVLAEMIAQLAENEGIVVERNIPYGTTAQVMEATKQDVIDIYPEYNGTSLTFLGQAPTSDGEQATETVQKLFKPLGLEMGGRFGFSNDYTIVMTAGRAQELGITNISGLANLGRPVSFAVDDDFLNRPADGLQQLARRYGITLGAVEEFPVGTEGKDQIVDALLSGEVDAAELFETDGQIAEYDLVVLSDNLDFFPVYEAAPLVRSDALANHAALAGVLDKLAGAVSAADMQAMNKAVDLDAQTPASVATAFLVGKGLLPEGSAGAAVEELNVAVEPGVERGSEIAKALRAVRAGFTGNDIELLNSADPLTELAAGRARVALVGAESFYTLGEQGPVRRDDARAFAVVGYKTAHLMGSRSGSPRSIADMQTIVTGAEGTGSARALGMILYSLGIAGEVTVTNSTASIEELAGAVTRGDYDGAFVMAPTGDREVATVLDEYPLTLVGLYEWAEGGHTARFSFIRPSTIAARTYESQYQPLATVSTQTVLASPVKQEQQAGEVGPGTAGIASALPVSADAVKTINEALGTGEVIDPAMPVHAALVPAIEVVEKSLPFRADISVINILVILFTVWVIYLCTLPSPRDFTLPDDDSAPSKRQERQT